MQPLNNITISKLIFGGQGLGHTSDAKPVFVWNALPGETVDMYITKTKSGNREGIATMVHKQSPHRIPPREEHYLSTSPWQIMTYEHELHWKKTIAQETYHSIGKFDTPRIEILGDDGRQFNYRNKMEYSFTLDEQGELSLAFFARGQKRKIPVVESILAYPWINHTAKLFLAWAKTVNLTPRELKSLVIRGSQNGETIAGLFIKDPLTFDHTPELDSVLTGFQIYYSTHKSPASVPTELLHSKGNNYLTETLNHNDHMTQLRFGLFSFFQVNVPMFQQALCDIVQHIPQNKPLVDLYSGVGAIGLSLAHVAKNLTMIDNVPEAIEYAQQNIKFNNFNHASAICDQSENMLDVITQDSVIIVDPPRAGLHKKIIEKLLEQKPSRIIYLSCDLATQSRDIALLSDMYTIPYVRVYNFFPRTPHIESLCVLEKN